MLGLLKEFFCELPYMIAFDKVCSAAGVKDEPRVVDWDDYERSFRQLLESRQPDKRLSPVQFDHACLLCSEPTPEHCHRRLVAEYLKMHWGNVDIQHL